FYEKKGLLNPIRHNDNDYRQFTSDDILKLQLILLYRSIGLSVKDIESIFNNTNK
ncbi:MAG: MerR family transcriptional regulator, partial [Paraclostridium sp.]